MKPSPDLASRKDLRPFAFRHAVPWVLLAALTFSPAYTRADELCEIAASSKTAPDIASPKPGAWSFEARDLSVSPEQLLPRDFLERLRSEGHELKLRLSWETDAVTIQLRATDGRQNVLKLTLYRHPERSRAIICEDLELEMPAKNVADGPVKGSTRIHVAQLRKGLPASVSLYARDRILEIVRAGGANEVASVAQTSYLVSQLYRRMIGMKPANELSAKTFALLDRYYRFAMRSLPGALRARSADDFSRLLNRYASDQKQSAWAEYLRTGVAPRGTEVLSDDEGVVGMLFGNTDFFFANPMRRRLMSFFPLSNDGGMELSKPLI